MRLPLRSKPLAPFTVARAFQWRGIGASGCRHNRPALIGSRTGPLCASRHSSVSSLLQGKYCLFCAVRLGLAGPALSRNAGAGVGGGVGRFAPHAAGGGALWLQAPAGTERRRSAHPAAPSATLWPNPSFKRTCPGKPGHAA